jgi:hypothetical protein
MLLGGDFCAAVQNFFHSRRLLKQINHSIIALAPNQLMFLLHLISG